MASEKVTKLSEEILGLTLMEAQELLDVLKEQGIEPAAGGAPIMMGAMPQAGGDDEGGAEEKTDFDVMLKEIGDQKIQVIKAVKDIAGVGLKDAKALVDKDLPVCVKEKLPKDEAEAAKKKLEDAGALVDLK